MKNREETNSVREVKEKTNAKRKIPDKETNKKNTKGSLAH